MVAYYEVWDPNHEIPSTRFLDENRASKYRTALEKKHGRVFRINKGFSGSTLIHTTSDIEKDKNSLEVVFQEDGLSPGDIITSEKGILVKSINTGSIYRVTKMRVEGDGALIAIEKKEVK